MTPIARRDLLKATAAVGAGGLLPAAADHADARAAAESADYADAVAQLSIQRLDPFARALAAESAALADALRAAGCPIGAVEDAANDLAGAAWFEGVRFGAAAERLRAVAAGREGGRA